MEPDLSHLPESARKLVALIGVHATLRLIDRFGGCTITLYGSENSLNKMAEVVGADAALKLLAFYGNVPWTVPNCAKAMKAIRNDDIHAAFDRLTMQEGRSARAAVAIITRLCTPYLHERSIWRILKRSSAPKPVDPRQIPLL